MTIEEFLKAHFENKIKNHECLVLYDPDKKMEGTGGGDRCLTLLLFSGIIYQAKKLSFFTSRTSRNQKDYF
jgi:hypothetical protein